jgi:hypothetical protein
MTGARFYALDLRSGNPTGCRKPNSFSTTLPATSFGAAAMNNGQVPQPPAAADHPVSSFPKQAIVVVHGIGEQMPMDTIKGFVRAAWETVTDLTANKLPNPRKVWSKPDVRTGSMELRRITTRQSIPTTSFANGVRSDFYELYWADLSAGSTVSQVEDWVAGLLLRNPFTRVPRDVFLAWILLWLLSLMVILLAIATALPKDAAIGSFHPWDCPGLKWLFGLAKWQLALATAALGVLTHRLVVPYIGRVVRYTRAKPDNIAARKNIRERGLELLSNLHQAEYDRIIIVGHSLGSILAYDLISYFWAMRPASYTVVEGTAEFVALRNLEQAIADLDASPSGSTIDAYHAAQTTFAHLLRTRPKPVGDAVDSRWLITDLVTLGSPLSHAEFLMANSKADLLKRQQDREYPMSPPLREDLDPKTLTRAKQAGFPLDEKKPQLLGFPFGNHRQWQLDHATPFAAIRWTNIYDPARLVFFGDLISGAVAPVFGPAVVDVDLKALRGQSWRFTHTRYWTPLPADILTDIPEHIAALRDALDLGGRRRPL